MIDHRLVVATLKLHVKFKKPPRCDHTVSSWETKDLKYAKECAVTVSNRFGVLNTLEDHVELWDTFKRDILEAAKECIWECPRSWCGFTTVETLESIEESRAASTGLCHVRLKLSLEETTGGMSGVLLKMSSVI